MLLRSRATTRLIRALAKACAGLLGLSDVSAATLGDHLKLEADERARLTAALDRR